MSGKISLMDWEKIRKRLLSDYWLDSELIPRLLENLENWKNFMIILLNVKNDAYRRIFWA